MSRRKYNSKRSRPIFTDKKTGGSVAGVVFMIILLAILVFVGYNIGKPIINYFSGKKPVDTQTPGIPDPASQQPAPEKSEAPVTEDTEPVASRPSVTVGENDPENTERPHTDILFVSYDESISSYEQYIANKIEYASDNGFKGICIELVADGGAILYKTSNELAVNAGAVAENAVNDLSGCVKAASEAGLTCYARISGLSDHIVSWYTKDVTYIISGSTSRWLDNAADKGGKPWLSPFSSDARRYISSLADEISDAGFAGLVLGEVKFPQFRNRDLDYIGDSVRSKDRYKALCGFTEEVYNAFGSAKQFSIEIPAEDIISGNAEIISSPSELCTKKLYIVFDPTMLETRIKKKDGSEVSFNGLSTGNMLKTVLKLIQESKSVSEFEIGLVVKNCEVTDEIRVMAKEAGITDIVLQN